jgi:glucose-1-phosphate cytidylyltransferase
MKAVVLCGGLGTKSHLALWNSRNERKRVNKFLEKPKTSSFASAGFFVFEPGVFDYLDGDGCVLEREPMERLAADGQLQAYLHEGFFYSMDTYREYQHFNSVWAAGQAPWKVWK